MKFHNQRSFMGHEISNVNNKPLLHKKGKQWIVVAVSALILAGFGGMVSTTTHADTAVAQPTTTKVAKPDANTTKANQPNAKSIGQQATDLHKNLVNNSIKNSNKLNGNKITNNLTSVKLTAPTPTSGTAGSDNKATWNISDNTNLYIHGNGVNWYWPDLRPYKNVYISDIHFHGPGHMFSGLTNLKTITFANNVTNDAQFMDNDFNGDINLQTINGLNNFMDNDTSLQDYDYMFNNCINLKSLDLSNFNTTQVATSGQITYTNDSYKGDGNYQAFHNMPSLSHVILGKNSILHSDSGISPYAIPQGTMGTSFEKLDDNQSHANSDGTPRTWNLCKTGNWIGNNGHWYLNNDNGALLITGQLINSSNNSDDDGNSYQNLLKETGMSVATANTVKSISFSDAKAPKDSWRLFDDENTGAFKNLKSIDLRGLNTGDTTNFLAMFCGLNGLQHIYHLSDLNMANANDEQWMFGFDPSLQDLDLSQIQNPKFTNDGALLINDNHLHQLTLGENMSLGAGTNSPLSTWHNDNTGETTNINSLGQGTWNPVIKNSIHFNGAPFSDDKTVSDVDGASSSVSAPSNYHYINGNNGEFTYSISDGNHLFDVAPNTINITFNGSPNSSKNINTEGCTTNNYNLQSNVPNGYRLADPSENILQFKDSTTSYTVNVVPAQKTDTINYQYNGKSEGSHQFSGNDVAANGATNTSFILNNDNASGMPANYQLINKSQSFDYDGGTYNVAIEPKSATDIINYMNGSNKVGSAKFNGSYGDSFNIGSTPLNLNSKYYLVSNPTQSFVYDNDTYDVALMPKDVTNAISFNGDSAANTSVTGLYDNKGSVSAPNGYHFTGDNKGSFIYNGSSVSFSVAPNVDTDTVNYQINGHTRATQQFEGNDEHATQAGDNSFDVTAKNDAKIPNGYELVNNDNNFDFDNGTHNVAIQPIPQPAPYIPSMPISSAASASSASSAVVAPSSVASQTSVAPSASAPVTHHYYHSHYSHYRYAKVITPLQLHTSKHFTDKNGVLVIKHPTEFRIMRIVRDHKYTRYEVRYNHKNYFITANPKFTINDYVQKGDFKSRKHMMVRVITPLIEYKRSHFSKKYAIKVFKKGAVLPVKRVLPFGKGEMTRFQLTNGRYVTSNKLFVKVIK